MPDDTRKLLSEFLEGDYETLKQRSKFSSWAVLKRACDEGGVVAPSYATFCKAVGRRPKFDQTLKRQGHRAAYVHEPFCWELSMTTPRHGDRPYEIGHIDHTELDVEIVCSQTRVEIVNQDKAANHWLRSLLSSARLGPAQSFQQWLQSLP